MLQEADDDPWVDLLLTCEVANMASVKGALLHKGGVIISINEEGSCRAIRLIVFVPFARKLFHGNYGLLGVVMEQKVL